MLGTMIIIFVLIFVDAKTLNTSVINTPEDFKKIQEGLNGVYLLGANIDLDESYQPIDRFSGSLDGSNHRITLTNQRGKIGLFGSGFSGSIRNLKVHISGTITGSLQKPVGSLIGEATRGADIQSITIEGSIVSKRLFKPSVIIGGVVGSCASGVTMSDLASYLNIELSGNVSLIGGIAGMSEAICTRCFYKGHLNANNPDIAAIGGLYGEAGGGGALINSAVYGSLVVTQKTMKPLVLGGLVGNITSGNFIINQSYSELLKLSIDSDAESHLGGFVGNFSQAASSLGLLIQDSYVRIDLQHLSSPEGKNGSKLSTMAGLVGHARGDINVTTSYVRIKEFSITGSFHINSTLSVITAYIKTELTMTNCYLEAQTVILSNTHKRSSFAPIANLIEVPNGKSCTIQEIESHIKTLKIEKFSGHVSLVVNSLINTQAGSIRDCYITIGKCVINSAPNLALFYGTLSSNGKGSYIIANANCSSITSIYQSHTSSALDNIGNHYFNSDLVRNLISLSDQFVGLSDDRMRKHSSYPQIDTTIWSIDDEHYPHLRRTPHYRDGAYIIEEKSKWKAEVWSFERGILLIETQPPPFCGESPPSCNSLEYLDILTCKCVVGCPNLVNGHCIGPNTPVCDVGYKQNEANNCVLYSCKTAYDKCPLMTKSSNLQCDETIDLCICPLKSQYYNYESKSCIQGCDNLVSGVCSGINSATCEPGWVTDGNVLCARYTCSQHRESFEGICGGPTVATCNAVLGICICPEATHYYDFSPTVRSCTLGCPGGVQYGVCIGHGEAACMQHVSSAQDANAQQDLLCTIYTCSTVSCGLVATCNSVLSVCQCPESSQYYDLQKRTCVPGCPSLMYGICTRQGYAKCMPGYFTDNDVLCGKYLCADDPSSTKCNGLGTCEGGKCICDSFQGAVSFLGSCRANFCISGTVKDGVCECAPGWSSPLTNEEIDKKGYCSIFTCPDLDATIDLDTDGSLGALKACPSHKFRLVADIMMSRDIWEGFAFSGILDGNGHTLSNIRLGIYKDSTTCGASFFQKLTSATLRNIQLSFASDLTMEDIRGMRCQVGLLAITAVNVTVLENVSLIGRVSVRTSYNTVELGGVFHTCPPMDTAVSNQITLVCEGKGSKCEFGGYCHTIAHDLTYGASIGTLECIGDNFLTCIMGGFAYIARASISGITSRANLLLNKAIDNANISAGGIVAVLTANASNCLFSGEIIRSQDLTNAVDYAYSGGAFYTINGTADLSICVKNCNVRTTSLSGLEMAGFAGKILYATIHDCNVIVEKVDGISAASGFVHHATNSTIKRAFIKAGTLSVRNENNKDRRKIGGFCGVVTNSTISSCYARIGKIISYNICRDTFVGGFLGHVISSSILNSFAQVDLLEAINTKHVSMYFSVGGFAGFIDLQTDRTPKKHRISNCYGDIGRISVQTRSAIYLGGFIGQVATTSKLAQISNNISSVWINTKLECTFSGTLAGELGIGMFAGKMYSKTSLTHALINGTIEFHTEGSAEAVDKTKFLIGLLNGAVTSDGPSMVEFALINVTAIAIRRIRLIGSNSGMLTCTSCFINSDLLPSLRSWRSDATEDFKTTEELKKKATYSSFSIGGSTSYWTKMPGVFPVLTALPAKVIRAGEAVYIYPACDLDDCWDYSGGFLLPSAQGPASDIDNRDCHEMENCIAYDNACQCTSCTMGNYFNGIECVKCAISNCIACSSIDFCEICGNGLVSNGLGICTDNACDILYCEACSALECRTCSPGSILSELQCIRCHTPCATCEDSTTTCTTCITDKYKPKPQNGICICKDGFYSANSDCLPCNETCKTCRNGNANGCLTCNDGDIFDSATNTCSLKCQLPDCLSCLDSQRCNRCKDGFDNVEGQCLSNTICRVANCQSCDSENMDRCKVCKEGFFSEKYTCSPCPLNCSTCSSALNCTKCDEDYSLTENRMCVLCSVNNCVLCSSENSCAQCEIGYYRSGGTCKACSIQCKECIDMEDKCTSCNEGHQLNGYTCVLVNVCDIAHCVSCAQPGICEQCERGYYLAGKRCNICDLSCAACSGPNTCTECASSNAVPNELGICVSTVCGIKNCAFCDLETTNICSRCDSGYILVENRCQSINVEDSPKWLPTGIIVGISVGICVCASIIILIVVILFKKGMIRRRAHSRYTHMENDPVSSVLNPSFINSNSPRVLIT